MINVCYMVDAPFLGGAERYISRIALGLDRSQFRPSLVIRVPGSDDGGLTDWATELESSGVPIEWVRMRLPFRPWDAPGIIRALEKFAPHVVHVNMPGPYDGQMGLLAPLARIAGTRAVVVTEHLPMVERLWKRALVKRLAYLFVDSVLTVARANVPYLSGSQSVRPDKIVVVPNGLRDDFGTRVPPRQDIRDDLQLGHEDVGVLFIGNVLRHKGLHRVIGALETIDSDRWRLLVVGKGPDEERCRARLVKAGLLDRATFLGAMSPRNVEGVLSAVDVLTLPSTIEGMPYVILEAMASGVPVVAGGVFGIPEMIEDGRHGFLVEPTDGAALASALGRLITDDDLRRSMGALARERFRAEFTLSRQVAAIQGVYRRLVGHRRRGGSS